MSSWGPTTSGDCPGVKPKFLLHHAHVRLTGLVLPRGRAQAVKKGEAASFLSKPEYQMFTTGQQPRTGAAVKERRMVGKNGAHVPLGPLGSSISTSVEIPAPVRPRGRRHFGVVATCAL